MAGVLVAAVGGAVGSSLPGERAPTPGSGGDPAPGPLGLAAHRPAAEAVGVDPRRSVVEVRFDRPVDPATVTAESFRVGYLDPSGALRAVTGSRALAEGGRTVRFRPSHELRPGVYYRVRLEGGMMGVRSRRGAGLPAPYRWRFATAVEMDRGGAADRPAPGVEVPLRPLGDRGTGGPRAVSRREGALRAAEQAVPAICHHEMGERAGVEVHVYQSVCDAPLIEGKTTLVRVYAKWSEDPEVASYEQVVDFPAEVIVAGKSDRVLRRIRRHHFYRPDTRVYRALAVTAENTANAFGWRPRRGGPVQAPLTARVRPLTPYAPRFDPGVRDFRFAGTPSGEGGDFDIPYHYLRAGEWSEGVPEEAVERARRLMDEVARFAAQNFPVATARAREGSDRWDVNALSKPVPLRKHVPAYPGADFSVVKTKCGTRHKWEVEDGTQELVWETLSEYLRAVVGTRYGTTGTDDLIVGFVDPRLIHSSIGALHVPGDRVVIVPLRPWMNAAAVVHELGHFLTLDHCPTDVPADRTCGGAVGGVCPVEGFRLRQEVAPGSGAPGGAAGGTLSGPGFNKSETEGNAESGVLEPLMHYSSYTRVGGTAGERATVKDRFISYPHYMTALESLDLAGVYDPRPDDVRLAARGQRRPAGASASSAVPGPSGPDPGPGFRPPRATGIRPAGGERPGAGVGAPDVRVTGLLWPNGGRGVIEGAAEGHWEPVSTRQPRGGPWTVELLDAGGTSVGRRSFDLPPEGPSHLSPPEGQPRPFRVVVPATGDVRRLVLSGPAGPLDTRSVSASRPTARLAWPEAGDRLRDGSRVRWRGTDPDGDPLTYTLYYSPDGRRPWAVLMPGTSSDGAAVALEDLRPGPSPTLRLVASDGFHRSEGHTVAVRVEREVALRTSVPADGDTISPADPALGMTFDTDLDPAEVSESTVRLTGPGGEPVPLAVRPGQRPDRVSAVPRERLAPGARYSLTVKAGLTDRYGNRLPRDLRWSFHTAPDRRAPFVLRTWPRRGAITIPEGADVRVVFSEPVDPASLRDGSVRLLEGTVRRPVPGTVSFDSATRTATFRPDTPLSLSTSYELEVTRDVRDPSGNRLQWAVRTGFTTAGTVRPTGGP